MLKIKVNMTEQALYDFLLYHAYSKWTGLCVNILGLAFVFMGLIQYFTGMISFGRMTLFFFGGLLFLFAIPVQLKMRSKKYIKVHPEYNQLVEYDFSDNGIIYKYGDHVRNFTWNQMTKCVISPKNIGIYYGKDDALIIPKWEFGELFSPIFQMSMYYTEMNRLGKLDENGKVISD